MRSSGGRVTNPSRASTDVAFPEGSSSVAAGRGPADTTGASPATTWEPPASQVTALAINTGNAGWRGRSDWLRANGRADPRTPPPPAALVRPDQRHIALGEVNPSLQAHPQRRRDAHSAEICQSHDRMGGGR